MNANIDMYDRQSRTYGIDGTKKIQNSTVILFGQKSDLLFEVGKNLILSGVNKIYIVKDHNLEQDININISNFDESTYDIKIDDSDEPFFGNIHNITYNRIRDELNDLNSDSIIRLLNVDEDYTNEEYKNATMIFINHNPIRVMELNNNFRDTNKFIVLNVYKDEMEIINDFNIHHITDIDGENYERVVILDLIIDSKVTIKTANKHNLSKNNKIKVIMNDLTYELLVLKIINRTTFETSLIDTINDIKFINGYMERIKDQMVLNHKPILNFYIDNKLDHLIETYRVNPLIQSFIGSILASECIKSITNKYMPFDQVNIFKWDQDPSDAIYYRPSLENIVKLQDLKIFIVGSGAIGCELLKNLASIGIRNIEITDPDHIELSNLSRQFLFRKNDINKSKSIIASNKIMKYNPNVDVKPYTDKLDIDNQKFVDQHFPQIDIVFNALDNLKARLYVDANIKKYMKPLFESGTMGNSGNTQPIIPNITETYGASKDPEGEISYAVCTIKHFPSLIVHTIFYAMEDFTNLFDKEPQSLIKYFLNESDNHNIVNNRIIKMLTYISSINSIDGYIQWAYCLFYDRFIRRIRKILDAHPLDSEENGTLFWSNGKRAPNGPIPKNIFYDYMLATTYLLIDTYNTRNIKYDENKIINYNYYEIDFNMYIDDPDYSLNIEIDREFIRFGDNIAITPATFDKDNDDNRHIAYITACSNIRASIYKIPNATFFEVKGIAGRIIPALATTTAATASLITLEMLKYVINKERSISDYKSYFINLATNLFIDGEPNPPKKNMINNIEFNEWSQNKFSYNSNIILKDLVQQLSNLFNIPITMIIFNRTILFSDVIDVNLNKTLKQISIDYNIGYNNFNISIGSDDDMLELPDITITME